jgi:phosphatidylserine/phosphatidylglycerophosphate/cardiolipin synthase-like enzyme
VRLIVQPGEGALPLIKAIGAAKSRVEIVIFRFDQKDIERALGNAVGRGVAVQALIASKNRAGEENLRELELRLLAAGVTVSRTADDLIRYHSKLMIIDRRELHLLAFNLTHIDMERSRSFALITRKPDVVREAVKLFEADTKRTPYEATLPGFVVSPVNARKELAAFIAGAKKSLAIYDPQVSDRAMIRILAERAKAGVEVRVLGRMIGRASGVSVKKLANMRLHTRTIVRDGRMAFLGSQSLREMELDARREVGLIFREPKAVSGLLRTFEADWLEAAKAEKEEVESVDPGMRIAKKVAKAVAREMPEVGPLVNGAMREIVGEIAEMDLIPEEVDEMVKGAVKEAVREVVKNAVEQAVEKSAGGEG